MANAIDTIMGFNPQDLSAFQEKGPKSDLNIYKTNPKDAKSEDGIYRAKVKILLNPWEPKESIVPQATYWLNSMDGSRLVRSSLSEGDRNCKIFKGWKRLWFSGDEAKKNFSKTIFEKSESQWVLVQILEDENKPELVGQFRVMKLAKDIYDKLVAKMNPSASSGKQPYPVMDYVIGLALELEVQPGPDDPSSPARKQREISYALSQFGDYATVIKTDGTSLLNEDEIELIDTYVTAINDAQNGKTAKKKQEGNATIEKVRPQIIPIYQKVITYVTENIKDVVTGERMDLKKYCGFQPWDEETNTFVDHFLEMTDAMVDPSTMSYAQFEAQKNANVVPNQAAEPVVAPTIESPVSLTPKDSAENDLPF